MEEVGFYFVNDESLSLFKKQHTLETRQAQALQFKDKYPDRIPVIVEKALGYDFPGIIDAKKYLIPDYLTVRQFRSAVRQSIKLDADKDLCIFVKNRLPLSAALMSKIYEENKDEDGFLYMTTLCLPL